MVALFCDDGWLDCLKDILLAAVKPAIDGLIKLIFDPILDALAKVLAP